MRAFFLKGQAADYSLPVSPYITGAQIADRQVAMANKLCTVATDIGGFSVWNLLRVILQVPRILRWFRVFFKFMHPCWAADYPLPVSPYITGAQIAGRHGE